MSTYEFTCPLRVRHPTIDPHHNRYWMERVSEDPPLSGGQFSFVSLPEGPTVTREVLLLSLPTTLPAEA